jgi:hypothetical protein
MTIERPMFPPRAGKSPFRLVGGIDVAATPDEAARHIPIARPYASTPASEYLPRPRRYAKNPLRRHVTRLSMAIVEANKLDEFIDCEALKYIRNGIDAARILADELSRLAERLEG